MAEKSEVLVTKEEKVAEAKELFGRGSRNFCMRQYTDAADDLSSCCAIYSELYGASSEECGMPYLLYAKSLIALGKDENNLIVPGEGEEGEDEDGEGEDGEGEDGEGEDGEGGEEGGEDGDDKEESEKDKEEKAAEEPEIEEKKSADPQPGPSTSNGAEKHDTTEDNEEDDDEKGGGNLEVAWEILELAVKIFQSQGDKSLENLSECYSELATISMENSNFAIAVDDYKRSLAAFAKTGKTDSRLVAEIHYKIGLCHLMQSKFEDSIVSFREACGELDKVLADEKAKEQNDDTKATIKDLEETKQEIMDKITEVEETKKMSIEEVKRELSKVIVKGESSNGFGDAGSSGAHAANGTSSSSKSTEKPTDISHLIKRKKPDTPATEVEGSPAKKSAVEADKSSE